MMGRYRASAIAVSAVLTGCTVIGPSYDAPQTDNYTEPAFINASDYDTTAPLSNWWVNFDDPVLDALIIDGIEENNALARAIANVNVARGARGLAELNRVPFDRVDASYLETRTASAATPFAGGISEPFPNLDVSRLDFSAGWEVDLFGRVTRTINIANADLARAEADLADLQAIVIADITEAYVNLRGLQAQLSVARQNTDVLEETVRLTEATRDAGRGTDIDVDLARAQLEQSRATIPPLRAAISASIYQLAVLTRVTSREMIKRVSAPSPLPLVEGKITIGDPASLLRRRPDIAAAERALAAASEQIGLSMAEAFPRIDLIGAAGFSSLGFNDQFAENALSFSVGPSITWSLTNLLRARQTIAAARAGAVAAFETYEQTILSALAEAETAFAEQARLQEQIRHLAEADRASTEAARLARIRYDNGATTFLNVLDAERRQLEAANALAAGRTALARAQVRVFRALRAGPVLGVKAGEPGDADEAGDAEEGAANP